MFWVSLNLRNAPFRPHRVVEAFSVPPPSSQVYPNHSLDLFIFASSNRSVCFGCLCECSQCVLSVQLVRVIVAPKFADTIAAQEQEKAHPGTYWYHLQVLLKVTRNWSDLSFIAIASPTEKTAASNSFSGDQKVFGETQSTAIVPSLNKERDTSARRKGRKTNRNIWGFLVHLWIL